MIEYKLEYCRKRNRLINLRPNQLFSPGDTWFKPDFVLIYRLKTGLWN
jgi:hypothetical protein